jgi:hypothetical protein
VPCRDLTPGQFPAALVGGGPIRQFKIGGYPVGQLPAAMPKTISATDYLLRSPCPPDARRYAVDLLLALAAVEGHASPGGRPIMIPALLRDLVIITARLAGRTWLEANVDKTRAFIAMRTTVHPPPLPELDHILACVLSERFGLPRPRQHRLRGVRCSADCL